MATHPWLIPSLSQARLCGTLADEGVMQGEGGMGAHLGSGGCRSYQSARGGGGLAGGAVGVEGLATMGGSA